MGGGFAEKEGFKSGMKERVGDEKLIIVSVAVRGINDHIRFYSFSSPSVSCICHRNRVATSRLCNLCAVNKTRRRSSLLTTPTTVDADSLLHVGET